MLKEKSKLLFNINKLFIGVTIIICIFYAINYYLDNDYKRVVNCFVALMVFLAIFVGQKFIKKKIPEVIKSYYFILVFISAILGGMARFYKIPLYDKFVHLSSGILISLALIAFLKTFKQKKIPFISTFFGLFIIGFNAIINILWETSEYIIDLLFNQNFQKGLNDTMLDMILGMIGSMIIILWFRFNKKRANINI